MSVTSSSGSTPWAKRFIARVTTSTLPVRSPLPNSVPSTRSAPASTPELGGGHGAAAVIVRVQGQHETVTPGDAAEEPLDGIGVQVRRVHFHRRGQVQHDLPIGGRLDHVHDRLADLDGELHLGPGIALGRVLVEDLGIAHRLLELPAQLGGVDRDVDDARLVEAEHDPPLEDGRGVVEVHDGPPGALQALVGPVDQLGPALHEHLDGDVVGNQVLLDEEADEVEVGLRRRRESRPRSP